VQAGVSIPLPRTRPRTKNTNSPHTRTQLNRLFPVKFGVGAGFVAMSKSNFYCLGETMLFFRINIGIFKM